MSFIDSKRTTRRSLLKTSGLLSAAAVAGSLTAFQSSAEAEDGAPLPLHKGTPKNNLFTQLGVLPIINAHGTLTLGGPLKIPKLLSGQKGTFTFNYQLTRSRNGSPSSRYRRSISGVRDATKP